MIQLAEHASLDQDRDAWKCFVFRKNREWIPLWNLATELEEEIQGIRAGRDTAMDALIRAGEIETGLSDAGSEDAGLAAKITDQLAAAALGVSVNFQEISEVLARINKSGRILCSYPEGFSYYGLNPLDFSDLVERVRAELPSRVAIVGIRSVGSTLGAIVAAASKRAGIQAARITVRPEGEPYQRKMSFDAPQMTWVRSELEAGSDFLVVDEGPGFSGSTFLSVAGALADAGVPSSRIVLLCSRPFRSRNECLGQVKEWARFKSRVINYGCNLPPEAGRSVGGGAWRELLYDDCTQWPASWTEMERIKHLSKDGAVLFKFEGFGRFGKLARDQAALLAEVKLSPRLRGFDRGYGCYDFLRWRPMNRSHLDRPLLNRVAEYCAFRAGHFPAADTNPAALLAMAQVNLELEFGMSRPISDIPVERPVYADCRMQPHEWIVSPAGQILKTDAAGHGEGHHLPGPVDIAWDLAGAVVEWELGEDASAILLREYFRLSGDDASLRIRPYLLLYSVFRMALCRMAAASLAGSAEAGLLRADYRRYTEKAHTILLHSLAS